MLKKLWERPLEIERYVRLSWMAFFMAAAVLMAASATLYYNPGLLGGTENYGPDHYSY